MAISGISNSLNAIQRQSAALDRATAKVARATSGDITETPTTQAQAEEIGAQETDLITGTVEMMVAKRMFTAALKAAQVSNESISEALQLGNYDHAA